MKPFVLYAEFEFDAEDIEDAFEKLALHFTRLAQGEESDLIKIGECAVHKLEEDTK